ncbi:uncharacterized protein LOC130827298 isoform X2 [Amaranthus tricolor]|uniref:uncharacterized protein LOC130827298 isoform X2 n=1 Tax=Amaranthus tricolor TaxID=29722 RepID=UPI0025872AEA|nr:uncharacterized protein LOC130827298 isoform X2 [Amaranthus tricolor]
MTMELSDEEQFWNTVKDLETGKGIEEMGQLWDYIDDEVNSSHPLFPQLQESLMDVVESYYPPPKLLKLTSDIPTQDLNYYLRAKLQYLILDLSTDIESLSNSLGELQSLQHLTITGNKLSCLPTNITRLTNLQELELHWCPNLEYLPQNFGEFVSLTELSIKGCKIRELPKSIINLKKLLILDVEQCLRLENFPPSFDQLVSLNKLSFTYCGIKYLPTNILKLHKLKILDLRGCFKLKALPPYLSQLVNLEKLHIRETNIKLLPCSIKSLKNLKVLDLPDCYGFRYLIHKKDKLFDKIPPDKFVDDEAILNHDSDVERNRILCVGDDSHVSDASNLAIRSNDHPCDGDQQTGIIASQDNDMMLAPLAGVYTSIHESHITMNISERINTDKQVTSESLFSYLAQGKKLQDAADEAGVSRSTFKRRCRKNGIQNWAKRKNNTNHLNANKYKRNTMPVDTFMFHDASKTSTKEAFRVVSQQDAGACEYSSRVNKAASSIQFLVKASYKDDILRFNLESTSSMAELKEKVQERVQVLEDGKFKIKYQDDDEDWVIMACNDDLQDCFRLSTLSRKDRVTLKILDSL